MSQVAGTPIKAFEVPVHDSLKTYQELSQGSVKLDLAAACRLELTPDKPNSARSVTLVQHLGETIGNLCVIAFAPHDGTGDESAYSLKYTDLIKGLPREAKVLPRAKTGVHSEVHLALAAKFSESADELVPFAGCMDITGFNDQGSIGFIGSVGQGISTFVNALESRRPAEPRASLTVGEDYAGHRVGDPHAIYNGFSNVVQLAAFIAISDEMAPRHASLVDELGARFRF